MAYNDEFLFAISKARKEIFAAYRMDEQQCVTALLQQAQLNPAQLNKIQTVAQDLVQKIRQQHQALDGWDALMAEYDLGSAEGRSVNVSSGGVITHSG